MWVTFLGNSSQWCYHWIFRDPTLTQTKHRRDYVDRSRAGLYQYYCHPTTIIWHPARPVNPSQNTRAPSPLAGVYGFTRLEWIVLLIICFTFIQATLCYYHTGEGLHTHGDKLDIKSQTDHQSSGDGGKISQLYTHDPATLQEPQSLSPDNWDLQLTWTCNLQGLTSDTLHVSWDTFFTREKRSKQKLLVLLKFSLWH